MNDTNPADLLSEVLVAENPTDGLWGLVDSGWAETYLPELPALRLEQDPIHRHKDVLSHTISVTSQSPARLRVRLAALSMMWVSLALDPTNMAVSPSGTTRR